MAVWIFVSASMVAIFGGLLTEHHVPNPIDAESAGGGAMA